MDEIFVLGWSPRPDRDGIYRLLIRLGIPASDQMKMDRLYCSRVHNKGLNGQWIYVKCHSNTNKQGKLNRENIL